jgi:hypothetical protein
VEAEWKQSGSRVEAEWKRSGSETRRKSVVIKTREVEIA